MSQLAGLTTFTYGFHTKDSDDPTKYDNWHFTQQSWDDFWYS